MDDAIEKYRFKGNVYIWEQNENNPGKRHWNLAADIEGCASLLQLLKLMDQSKHPSKKSVRTTTPSSLQTTLPNKHNINWRTKTILTLKLSKSNADNWEISTTEDALEIYFCKPKLKALKEAISKIKSGKGDFAISDNNDNSVLYFWWNLIG